MGSVNPYVFLVGCPRSGTTLLQRLVDAHPSIAALNETLWIPGYYERREGLTPEGLVTPALVRKLLEHRRFERMGIERAELDQLIGSNGKTSYAEFVSALFDRYARARAKPLVADKSPAYVRSIPILHHLWPFAKFVHLIRDGRDVALSFMSWAKADRIGGSMATWQDDRVTTVALWWERNVRLGREDGSPLGRDRYYELRYEALASATAQECEALCGFLDLPYERTMIRFHEGKTKRDPGLPSKRAWLPPTPGLRDWRTEMGPPEVERFEAAAGSLLDELGYERAFPQPGADVIERVDSLRERFAAAVRAHGKPLPRAWAER
jgi:hypothetical protein